MAHLPELGNNTLHNMYLFMEGRFLGELASRGGFYDFDETVASLHSEYLARLNIYITSSAEETFSLDYGFLRT